jgi:hypothetical protein
MWRRAFACNAACCMLPLSFLLPVAYYYYVAYYSYSGTLTLTLILTLILFLFLFLFLFSYLILIVRVPALHAQGDQRPAAVAARLHPRQARPGLTPSTSAPGLGLTPATSAPGLGSPLPRPHRDWAHPCHVRTRTGADHIGSPHLPICTGAGLPPLCSPCDVQHACCAAA